MSDHQVRVLEPDEFRAANDLFRSTLHVKPAPDERWEIGKQLYEAGRVLGVGEPGTLIGTADSFASEILVPGGKTVPMAAVTRVGVRAGSTRRGVLTAMMRAQLAGCAERGEPIATLRASEGVIYGRFGYGVATRGGSYTLDRRHAVPRPDVPGAGGEIRLLSVAEAIDVLPAIYAAGHPSRAGQIARPTRWWQVLKLDDIRSDAPIVIAVHRGIDSTSGDDGFVVYSTEKDPSWVEPTKLAVRDLWAADAGVFADLWRFLLGIDLVREIRAGLRPLDEPTELLFVDPRTVKWTEVEDETWLRIVDVPAALNARCWGAGEVVLDVVDPLLPNNSGRYRVAESGMSIVDSTAGSPAALSLSVDTLAMLYLGDRKPSELARVGRIAVHDPSALRTADALFSSTEIPWCGTYF